MLESKYCKIKCIKTCSGGRPRPKAEDKAPKCTVCALATTSALRCEAMQTVGRVRPTLLKNWAIPYRY
jgi:hypothetical protein